MEPNSEQSRLRGFITDPPRPRLAAIAVDLNHAVVIALQTSAHRIEPRARLLCALGDPPLALGSSASIAQAVGQLFHQLADLLSSCDPRRTMVRITTVADPEGRACIDVLVVGGAARDLPLPSACGGGLARPRARLAMLHDVARRAGGELSCENRPGLGAWLRLALPAR